MDSGDTRLALLYPVRDRRRAPASFARDTATAASFFGVTPAARARAAILRSTSGTLRPASNIPFRNASAIRLNFRPSSSKTAVPSAFLNDLVASAKDVCAASRCRAAETRSGTVRFSIHLARLELDRPEHRRAGAFFKRL